MNKQKLNLKLSILSNDELKHIKPDIYQSITLGNPYCSRLEDYSEKSKKESIIALEQIKKLGAKCGITTPAVTVESQIETIINHVKELSEFIDYIEISDIGVVRQIKRIQPDLDIHIGALANISTQNSLNLIEKLKVKAIHPGYELDFNQTAELAAIASESTCIETTIFGKIQVLIFPN